MKFDHSYHLPPSFGIEAFCDEFNVISDSVEAKWIENDDGTIDLRIYGFYDENDKMFDTKFDRYYELMFDLTFQHNDFSHSLELKTL